jgi:hypothetical protein
MVNGSEKMTKANENKIETLINGVNLAGIYEVEFDSHSDEG